MLKLLRILWICLLFFQEFKVKEVLGIKSLQHPYLCHPPMLKLHTPSGLRLPVQHNPQGSMWWLPHDEWGYMGNPSFHRPVLMQWYHALQLCIHFFLLSLPSSERIFTTFLALCLDLWYNDLSRERVLFIQIQIHDRNCSTTNLLNVVFLIGWFLILLLNVLWFLST